MAGMLVAVTDKAGSDVCVQEIDVDVMLAGAVNEEEELVVVVLNGAELDNEDEKLDVLFAAPEDNEEIGLLEDIVEGMLLASLVGSVVGMDEDTAVVADVSPEPLKVEVDGPKDPIDEPLV